MIQMKTRIYLNPIIPIILVGNKFLSINFESKEFQISTGAWRKYYSD